MSEKRAGGSGSDPDPKRIRIGSWPPAPRDVIHFLREANVVAAEAASEGKHPFGAVLVGPGENGQEVLLQQGNISTVRHAESTLAQRAFDLLPFSKLQQCVLYTTFEPCAMCAGALYWAGIGGVVYGASEDELKKLTGNHPENPTLALPCREVLAAGQRQTLVHGPVPELHEEILQQHRDFWSKEHVPDN
eukprot:TRINITY_DN114668_c0_g1_i1.p1 TRINITY_DN114668_c0_g1~~TRINITY_DN114668_c0_g1_i1.p1  ORF type:complete len:190 (-),score=24.98 TRINITY_DN114668_c0_g1_i1:188-757(-)